MGNDEVEVDWEAAEREYARPGNIHMIPVPETDEKKAARHKAAIGNALEVVVQAMREAHRDGFEPQFGVGIDPYGRYSLQQPVSLVKRY